MQEKMYYAFYIDFEFVIGLTRCFIQILGRDESAFNEGRPMTDDWRPTADRPTWRQNWQKAMKMPSWRHFHHRFWSFCLHVGLPTMKANLAMKSKLKRRHFHQSNFAFMKAICFYKDIFISSLPFWLHGPICLHCRQTNMKAKWLTSDENAFMGAFL